METIDETDEQIAELENNIAELKHKILVANKNNEYLQRKVDIYASQLNVISILFGVLIVILFVVLIIMT